MTIYYRTRECELQLSEATTARRQMLTEVGTSEAKTVSVSKAGGAFAGATGTATTLADALDIVTLAAADLDTSGELAVKLEGATHTDYVLGMRVVNHDPFSDLADVADDTERAGDLVTHVGREVQKSEATTAHRTVYFMAGTSETHTVHVSKAGAAYATSSSTTTQIKDKLWALEIVEADLDTTGELAFEVEGATDTQYVRGIQVVEHDPQSDPYMTNRAVAGYVVTDLSDNSIAVYKRDELTAIAKRIKTTAGTQSTWAPTTV